LLAQVGLSRRPGKAQPPWRTTDSRVRFPTRSPQPGPHLHPTHPLHPLSLGTLTLVARSSARSVRRRAPAAVQDDQPAQLAGPAPHRPACPPRLARLGRVEPVTCALRLWRELRRGRGGERRPASEPERAEQPEWRLGRDRELDSDGRCRAPAHHPTLQPREYQESCSKYMMGHVGAAGLTSRFGDCAGVPQPPRDARD